MLLHRGCPFLFLYIAYFQTRQPDVLQYSSSLFIVAVGFFFVFLPRASEVGQRPFSHYPHQFGARVVTHEDLAPSARLAQGEPKVQVLHLNYACLHCPGTRIPL